MDKMTRFNYPLLFSDYVDYYDGAKDMTVTDILLYMETFLDKAIPLAMLLYEDNSYITRDNICKDLVIFIEDCGECLDI